MFQILDEEKEKDYREWARENDPPNMENWMVYHPVCREEWEKRGITKNKNLSRSALCWAK